ncbi:DUF362 domain-containing protein [Geothermobacter hydrogeniphilus]|uniref:DUF362 domain-containing protein n=1 Tax=Geothermobacter hydrogeniphilus TaxID=1969733 RepID=A0A1X0YCP2_9BACT|nr:DUF362 domain-containing protein [Geothermobacter hydrogeniphilus]ORJ62938.1 hypothetical protein B5V00_02485 [Geothermobacter hydrogeniphilus]
MNRACHLQPFESFGESLPLALEAIGAREILAEQQTIIIKPNLVTDDPPPVTLPVGAAMVLVRWLRKQTRARIILAEGTGDQLHSTIKVFDHLGYMDLAERYDLKLIDLNEAPAVELSRDDCPIFPQLYLPEVLSDSFVISFAVLKEHSLADVTLSMKNMVGCAPPRFYQQGGMWKKSAFHRQIHEAILDLNRYRKPDLALIDASVGMRDHHLTGRPCDPPPHRLIAGFDPVAVDAAGAMLLGKNWRDIPHIARADGELGNATAGETAFRMAQQPQSGERH